MAVLIVTATSLLGGAGWAAGRTRRPVQASIEEKGATAEAARPAAAVVTDAHAHHHAGHPPGAAAPVAAAARHDAHGHGHGHDCENGVCRCDSRCPPRRSGPCGGALRSCAGGDEDAAVGPEAARPFLLSARLHLRPALDSIRRSDPSSLPLSRDLEPVSPPPKTASV